MLYWIRTLDAKATGSATYLFNYPGVNMATYWIDMHLHVRIDV